MYTRARRAHTLIELLVVIAIIALIAMLAGVPGQFLRRTMVRAEIEKLRTVCTHLQRRAMATGTPQTLQLHCAANHYQIDDERHALANQVRFGTLPGVKGPPASPSQLLNAATTFDKNQIVFQPNGTIQSGAIYLIETGNRYLYALTIGAGAVPYVRTYCYTGQWHPLS